MMRLVLSIGLVLVGGIPARVAAAEDFDFFEKKIRPVLVERCYKCHSVQSAKLKGGLLLDSREGVLKGGENGPVLVPGDPDKSRLIEAERYKTYDLQMPPKEKLSDEQIADLVAWVKMGAPDPRAGAGVVIDARKSPPASAGGYDFSAAR